MTILLSIATLVAGFRTERTLSASEKHIYEVHLASGEAVLATLETKGAIVVEIEGKDESARFRNPDIDFTALHGGDYKVIVSPAGAPATYVLRVDRVVSAADNAKRLMRASTPSQKWYQLWLASLTDPSAIDRFLAERAGQPAAFEIVPMNANESRVIYVVGGDADTERVVINGGPEFGVVMRRLGTTNLFLGTQIVPNDARFEYSFALREVHHTGPSRQVEVAEIVSKGPWLLEMPQAPPTPETVADPGAAHGSLTNATIPSSRLNEEREIAVYTPPAYDSKTPCDLFIALDGDVYKERVPTPVILDHLIASRRITPAIAVLVMPMGKRNRDMTGNPDFAAFIADELVPWVREHYSIASGSRSVAVGGLSFGGFASAYCAMLHPEVVGNVISQSGAFWITKDWQSVRPPYPHDTGLLIEEFKQRERLPIRFYLEVGRFDLGAAILGSNRELRDVLQVKGYDVIYREFDGGHDVTEWRGSLARALEAIFGR